MCILYVMNGFRTKKGELKYKQRIKEGILEGECRLCIKPSITEFQNWRIVKNNFPYDAIAQIHDMIQSITHLNEDEITDEAWDELIYLKRNYLNEHYEFIIEPTLKMKTIPSHFHPHLLIPKENIS